MTIEYSLATFLFIAILQCQFMSLHSYIMPSSVNLNQLSTPSNQMTAQPSPSKSKLYMAGVPVVPYYPNKGSRDYQWMDIYNALGRSRTLFVGRFLDEENCNQLIASLIWLQGQSDTEPITMYFNVPGSIIKPAFAVYDVMRRLKCPVKTINMGLTVGMGALLCSVGTPGERYAMPNARFLMSRTGLEDGIQGQAIELSLAVKEVMKDNQKVIKELAKLCGQPVVKLEQDMKRDFYLTAPEAAAYGVIDKVLQPNQPIKVMRYRGSDDDVVGFGHFCEVRKLKEGPTDNVPARNDDAALDEYAARQLAKKKENKAKASRFAGLRCKPPAADDSGNDANKIDDNWKKDNFKNAF